LGVCGGCHLKLKYLLALAGTKFETIEQQKLETFEWQKADSRQQTREVSRLQTTVAEQQTTKIVERREQLTNGTHMEGDKSHT
jgi:hypothetical protein